MLRHTLCPRTNAYLRFATQAEKGRRQCQNNSTKTYITNIEVINF